MGDISSPAIKDDATIIELLGWGDVTVTRYESKTIQDETYDNVMRMVYNNPLFALECLDKQIDRFSSEKVTKLRKNS